MRLITLLGAILLLFCTTTFGQKADLKKANRFFKEDKYAAAIPHYQKALDKKDNRGVKSKLAYCYKITNQMSEAAKLYAELVRQDKVRTKIYYYYAETLMSNGQYDEAKKWFKKYAGIEIEDERATKMIAACDFAKTIPVYFGNVIIHNFSQNSEEDDNAPVFWNNGIVFTSDRKGKLKFLDTKSGTTDRSYLRLYHSEQLPDGTFAKPEEYISKINDARKNTGMATFQADGQAMFFTRNGNILSKKNAYCLQLYEAKADEQNWKKAEILPFCRPQSNYMHPAVSPDGQLLFFVSDKPRGMGGTDIYVSKKNKNGWGKPENVGNKINTEGHEGFPFMHANGKLYFCSKGHLGLGGYDIFVTHLLESGEWAKPTNLGAPINSPADDISIFIDEKEDSGLFTSSREGGDDDIFLLSFGPKALAINQVITKTSIPKKEKKLPIEKIATENSIDIGLITPKEQEVSKNSTKDKEEMVKIIPKTNFLQVQAAANLQQTMIFTLPTVRFEEGEYFITFKIAKELDKVAIILKEHPNLKIELAAHTANLGNYADKLDLTQKRSDSIVDYLKRKGIEANRVFPKGYGGKKPLNDCLMDIDCSVEEHTINDRIEIKVLAN